MNKNDAQGKTAEKSKNADKKTTQGTSGGQDKNGPKRGPSLVNIAVEKKETKNLAKRDPAVNGKSDAKEKLVAPAEQKVSDTKINKLSFLLKSVGGKRKDEQKSAIKNVKGSKEAVVEKKESKQSKETNDQEKQKGSKEKVENGKKKLKGSKEGTNDPNDQKMAKVSKEGLKDEAEKKDGKPKEGKGSEDAKKAIPVPPKKPHLLKVGEVLLDKFKVEGLLADGGFAQVFAAIHEDTQTRWAVKIESEKCDRKRMKLEIMVLMLLRGKANIPEIVAMGTCPTGHFIILELVGRNLSDLRRQLPRRKLSASSLYRAMLQVTHALSLVHGAGFLHRDLKPSNCCVGVDDVTRIYLLDYGLTRQYLDSTGQIRKPRESIGMRGTLRYVSLEAHARHDLGPNHDLVALLYSIIELGDGSLPWSKMREESAIKASKQETTVEKLCEKQPKMLKMAEYILSMKYETMPDYDKLTKMLESCNPPDVKSTDPYDWQITPCQLEHFVQREQVVEVEKPESPKKDNSRVSLTDPDKPKA
ncbi:hypothetical protein ANCCAN_02105 [Ancylostoma caninum]|uniref:non-specific serine/threonine protein kinase n=2 Tax=Ancylostoma TaxID=29169 RepID=A0A368H904_ANCCA|nr:hypothetical protein ANCCAN_02105 [Ancylostoma caninum]